jgi:hypothetical protein
MLDFSAAYLELLALHKVGNKSKGEDSFLSKELYEPADDQFQELMEYFLLPFKNANETYKFSHSTDIEYNEVYGYCTKIFKRKDTFLNRSIDIVKHLYDQSEHPNIKTGEVCIGYFKDIIYENESVDAIGIFKSERKESFFQFKKHGDRITINTQKGVHARKLDKGCIILNVESEDGLRLFTVDNNNYDAEYWKYKFLNLEDSKDFNYQTKNYIALCRDFSNEVIQPTIGKKEGISFLNQSMKYLSENDTLEFDEFNQTIFQSDELKKEFKKFKRGYEKENDILIEEEFEISKPTLKQQKKKLKNQITLDTQIQINLGNIDAEQGDKYIERGYDERKKMFFYKIYFNKEND